MIDQTTFDGLNKYTDNFSKIGHISSNLVYSTKKSDVTPEITILVITYKRPQMLREAIRSIAGQKSVDYPWEVLIMDNDPNSVVPDWLADISKNLALRYYINSQNLGHEGNMNRGIQLAQSEWIAFLHDDDLLVSNYLQLIPSYVQTAQSWKYPLAYIRANYQEFYGEAEDFMFDYMAYEENKHFWRRSTWGEMLVRGVGPTSVNSCGSLVNRQAFIIIGGYNEVFNPIGDSTLGVIFMNNGYCISETAAPLGFYRQGENESSKQETMYDFLRADYFLREYFYKRNVCAKLFGACFRRAQLYLQIQARVEKAQKMGFVLTQENLHLPITVRHSFFMASLIKWIQRFFLALYRPNIILAKWRRYNESRDSSRRFRNKN